MSEQSQHNDSLPQAEGGQDVVVLIKKMQQQLESLEKKVDILISQSQAKPFREKSFRDKPFRDKPFSKPYRSFGEKSFRPGLHFEKRHSEGNRGFSHQKKDYDTPQEGGFGQEHHFKKRYGGEKRHFDQKKKPFFFKRKDHR